jgi:hypothetical protein
VDTHVGRAYNVSTVSRFSDMNGGRGEPVRIMGPTPRKEQIPGT